MGQVTVEILCKIKYQEETEQGIEEIREEKLTKSKLSCKSTEARGADSVLFFFSPLKGYPKAIHERPCEGC